jgi:hypothetical protein
MIPSGYRIYIKIGTFLGIKLIPLGIFSKYIAFSYKGDEVWWKYPWKRKNKEDVWISLGFTGTSEFGDAIFPDLKSIDDLWHEWEEAVYQRSLDIGGNLS